MTDFQNPICDDEARRAKLIGHATLNGIDYIEVSGDQKTLYVYFVNDLPTNAYDLPKNLNLVQIEGGVRTQDIRVIKIEPDGKKCLKIGVDKPGDFSTYTLVIKSGKLDPVYAQCDFSFKAGCPSRFDCKSRQVCPTEPRQEPLIDYMAKDYASFRQALIDLIPTLAPNWKDRHEADLGMALVELLAYTGDHLSYYQDAVANEAYLETARQRISVRRHARLIDYSMHDGASARAFIHVKLTKNTSGELPEGTKFITRIDTSLSSQSPPHGAELSGSAAEEALKVALAVFETYEKASLYADLNEINLYTWGNRQCCLPVGTTGVDLVGDLTKILQRGDFLLFEEVMGPTTGKRADADPDHRQIVRLTGVEKTKDPLLKKDLTRVSWDRADALTFPLCVSAKKDALTYFEDVSVARGNLVLADHGRRIEEWYPGNPQDPSVPGIKVGQRAYRFRLEEGPLSFRVPLPQDNGTLTPAKTLLQTTPRQAKPVVEIVAGGTTWEPVMPHLLDSDEYDPHFTVETDNDGRALIRFGDDVHGLSPADDTHFKISYRVGIGTEGNVGTESLAHVINPGTAANWPSIDSASNAIRNPLPAWGGIDPEPIEQVKQLAPAAFHAEQFRAVTEADYAKVAAKHPQVSKAVATFRWTGSWHTIFVTVDPVGQAELPLALEKRVKVWITRYMLAGYDLEIDPPTYVPLQIEIDVCVSPDHFRAHVEEALLAALSNQTLPDGTQGFFHPDNFTFAQPLYLSQLYAAIEAVEGVDSATVTRFVRMHQPDPEPNRPATKTNVDQSYISMGRLEIARLDNDPSLPENGTLRLNMLGGK